MTNVTVTTVTKNDNPVSHLHDQSHHQRPALPRGRLMFALDATASRAPTWAIARDLQANMFREAAPIGHLEVQLVFYRGDECRATKWVSSGDHLAELMNRIECEAGHTQIGRVLAHARREAEKTSVKALIFVGDAVEEQIEELAAMAGKLGTLGVPIFLFQEGRDPAVRKAFRLLALKSGGAYFEFNVSASRAIEQMSDQLNAIARLAVGDAEALQQIGAPTSRPERHHDR
jgi:hypothetical protein